MFQIHTAGVEELRDVLGVLDDAAAWLQSIGVTAQWPASFSADPSGVERFQRWAQEGRLYLARDDSGGAAGCFRLMPSDDHIWQDGGGNHVYLHSLAVRRSAAGAGLATAMLDWASQHTASVGADELRLDCWAGNERLKRYYLDAGFEARGETEVDDAGSRYWVALFARKVS